MIFVSAAMELAVGWGSSRATRWNKIVAERLGDSEVTVMRTYSHVLPDMQETAAAAAIEPMLRGC